MVVGIAPSSNSGASVPDLFAAFRAAQVGACEEPGAPAVSRSCVRIASTRITLTSSPYTWTRNISPSSAPLSSAARCNVFFFSNSSTEPREALFPRMCGGLKKSLRYSHEIAPFRGSVVAGGVESPDSLAATLPGGQDCCGAYRLIQSLDSKPTRAKAKMHNDRQIKIHSLRRGTLAHSYKTNSDDDVSNRGLPACPTTWPGDVPSTRMKNKAPIKNITPDSFGNRRHVGPKPAQSAPCDASFRRFSNGTPIFGRGVGCIHARQPTRMGAISSRAGGKRVFRQQPSCLGSKTDPSRRTLSLKVDDDALKTDPLMTSPVRTPRHFGVGHGASAKVTKLSAFPT